MAWTELAELRNRTSRSYLDPDTGVKRWRGGPVLHYESAIDSGVHDAAIDATPVRGASGYTVTANGFHYSLSEDGWVGFGGRQGGHWFRFRLARLGYLHWPTRAWQDIGGPPTYTPASITTQTAQVALPDGSAVNAASVVDWPAIWTTPSGGSVSLRWSIDGDRLKEDVILSAAGRSWIKSKRPPTTPANETWFGFVFQVDWTDIPRVMRQEIAQDITGDFSDDGHGVYLHDAADRLLGLLPLDYVTAGTPDIHLPLGQWRAELRKRFWRDGDGNAYLLVGVRCDVLSAMQAGNLVFDPTVGPLSISADSDDGTEVAPSTWVPTGDNMVWCGVYDTHEEGGLRFTGVNVSKGATINSALINVERRSTNGTLSNVHLKVRGLDVDNVATFSSSNRPSTNALTTAGVDFDPTVWTAFSRYNLPDISTVVKEIVDRAGWASGNAMGFLIEDDGSSPQCEVSLSDYSYSNHTHGATLTIDYTEAPAGGVPIPVVLHHLRQQGIG